MKPKDKRAISETLASVPDVLFDPADDARDDIVAGSDLYEVGGVAEVCINCEVPLTVKDVEQDLKRCASNEWKEPDEFVCQKKECKKFRTSVSGYQVAEDEDPEEKPFVVDAKRRTEDGIVHEERPPLDVFLVTKHELGEEGIPKREARTDREIVADVMARTDLPQRCNAHGTPGCKPCAVNDALRKYYAEHPEALTKNKPTLPASTKPVANLPSLEDEVKKLLEKKRIAKLAKHPPKPGPEIRRVKEQIWVKKTYDKYSLRRLHGYSPRQLVDLFDSSRFNSSTRQGNSGSSRPFTLGQLDFYRDFARGKISREVLDQRVADGFYGRKGFETAEYLKRLEDDLVNRAWFVGLLDPKRSVVHPNDDDDWWPDDTEDNLIARGGSDLYIVGGKWKDTPGKTFKQRRPDSFEMGWPTRRVSGGSGGGAGRGDDYGERSDDEAA